MIYADDADRHVVFTVTDANGTNLTFTPLIAVNGGTFSITGAWLGTAAPVRNLSVPLSTLGAGNYVLDLQITGDNDVRLGAVSIVSRGPTGGGIEDLFSDALPYLATERLRATAGTYWTWGYELLDSAGKAVPLPGTAVAKLRTTPGAGGVVLTPTATCATGAITCTSTSASNTSLAAGTYFLSVTYTHSDNRVLQVVGSGDAFVEVKRGDV